GCEKDQGSPCAKQLQRPASVGHVTDIDVHALIPQGLDHVGIVHRGGRIECFPILELAAQFLRVDGHFADIALIHAGQELREVDGLFLLGRAAGPYHLPKENGRYHDDQPEDDCLYCRIHSELLDETTMTTRTARDAGYSELLDAIRRMFDWAFTR